VLVFAQPVTFTGATVTAGAGGSTGSVTTTTVPPTGPASEVTVHFTASNVQTVSVNLLNVSAGAGATNVSVPMAVLLGDTTINRAVNSSDVSQTKSQSGTVATQDNFRTDVTVNGLINSSDVSLVKSKSGTALP
jgi:hypothetical protein